MNARIIAEPPELSRDGDGQLATVRLWWRPGRGPERDFLGSTTFRFRTPVPLTEVGPEVSVSMALTPSLALGVPVECPVPVSRRFLRSWERMGAMMGAWFPGMKPLPVIAKPRDVPLEAPSGLEPGTGCYFSGGVDSWFTLSRLRSEITHLIYMDGFDMDLEKPVARRLSVDRLRTAAGETGLPLVVVETDARCLASRFFEPWRQYVGAGKAAVGQLLSPWLPRQFAASSYSWNESRKPVSSAHFLLVEGASTETLELREHGMATSRLSKVAALGEIPAALRHLRVCWDMLPDRINCARCEKCLRSMLELEIAGLLPSCKTLPHVIPPESVRDVKLPDHRNHMHDAWIGFEDWFRNFRPGSPLAVCLTEKLRRSEADRWSARLWSAGKELTRSNGWPALARALGSAAIETASRHDPAWMLRKTRRSAEQMKEALFWQLAGNHEGRLIRRIFQCWWRRDQ